MELNGEGPGTHSYNSSSSHLAAAVITNTHHRACNQTGSSAIPAKQVNQRHVCDEVSGQDQPNLYNSCALSLTAHALEWK